MTAAWLYVIGGVIIAVLAFTIGYRLISVSINQAQKQGAISSFNELHTNIQNVCFQEVNNYVLMKMEVPNSVRVIYVTNDTNSTLPKVYDHIKNKEISYGMNLCMQFKEEQDLRCRELNCNTDLIYMGVLPKTLDIQMMVKQILGRAPVKDYEIYIKKTGGSQVTGSDELPADATTTTGVPTTIPGCPSDRFCPDAPEAEEKCCPSDKPVCINDKHCCPKDKTKWCNKPKTGDPRCMSTDEISTDCDEEEQIKICARSSTLCYGHWHWDGYGNAEFRMNVRGKACDYYETCHDPVIQPIAKEIVECCDNKCAGDCHSMCQNALQDSGLSSTDTDETRKKCYGLYAIYGLGPAARWLKGYEQTPEQPASMMFQQGTWMCTGYSIEVTTLLRSVGYSHTEVYSACAMSRTNENDGHAYNLVKFPGESKYRFADTTGNNLYISGITARDGWREQYDICRSEFALPCQNDEYSGSCPSKSDIILGASC